MTTYIFKCKIYIYLCYQKMKIMSLPQVEGYDIIEKVGVGSFAVVYKAQKKVIC